MSPDPFAVYANQSATGIGSSSQLQTNTKSSNDYFFNHVLGLTQLSFGSNTALGNFEYQYGNGDTLKLNPATVGANLAEVQISGEGAPESIYLPDGFLSTVTDSNPAEFTVNTPTVWLADDATLLGNASASPLYQNAYGVYFSNGTVMPNTITNNPATGEQVELLQFQFQMDLFFNCTILANPTGSAGTATVPFDWSLVDATYLQNSSIGSWLGPLLNPAAFNGSGGLPSSWQAFNPLPGMTNLSPNSGVFCCNVVNDASTPIPLQFIYDATIDWAYTNSSGATAANNPGYAISQNPAPYFNTVLLCANQDTSQPPNFSSITTIPHLLANSNGPSLVPYVTAVAQTKPLSIQGG